MPGASSAQPTRPGSDPVGPSDRSGAEEHINANPVPWMHGAAGITAGACSMTLFYPLDLIRTRLHAQTLDPGHTRPPTVREIVNAEGVKGLYRGVKLAVAAHSIGWGMYLTTFRTFQQAFARYNGEDSKSGDGVAAICAAVTTATLITPLNVMKTRSQLNRGEVKAKSILDRVKRIAREEGVGSFFRGVGPQILLASNTTIQVVLYESLRRAFWGSVDKDEAPMAGIACISVLSKATATVVSNPLEVIRTRMQDKRNVADLGYSGFGKATRHIYLSEGFHGFYRGVFVNVCRVVPTTMTAFVIYEQVLSAMKWQQRRRLAAAAAPAPSVTANEV